MYRIYDSLFYRLLVLAGMGVGVYGWVAGAASACPRDAWTGIVLLAIGTVYWASLAQVRKGIRWWMWLVVLAQVSLAMWP